MVTCEKCGKTCKPQGLGTGYCMYTVNGVEKKLCYKCAGNLEKKDLEAKKPGERYTLYLGKGKDGKWYVSNWSGTLKFPARGKSEGRHNIGGSRVDVWFQDGKQRWWHGVQIGDLNQLCHCQLLKYPPDFVR